MAIDGMILSKVKERLDKGLPMRINRIGQVSSSDIILNVHTQNKRANLIVSTHSLYNRLHFTKMTYDTSNEPGAFVMGLRKYIGNGIIEKIEQPYYDRYLVFYIRNFDDLYDTRHYRLHIELMGKYANVILVDEDEKIIDALKRIPPFENNKRTIWPGAKFTYPDKQDKRDPFLDLEVDLNSSLVSQFMGFSPLLQKEIFYRIEHHEAYQDIIDEIKQSDKLYITTQDESLQYHIIPLKHLEKKADVYDIDEGFDLIYFDLEEKARIKEITGDLFKFVNREIKHYREKLAKLEDTLENAKNAEELRMYGDLLYMQGGLDRKGLEKIECFDFEGKMITINLDRRFSLKDNANRYYNNYQKKKRSTKYLKEQITITCDELEYFTSLQEQLKIANFNDAQMIRDELVKYGYLKASNKKTPKKKKDKFNLYQIHFKGHIITFGKNNVQNETLTFKYAQKDYMWFHAQKYHGAHLCVDTSEPDEETIRMCANIAAYYSNGRYSSSVPVDYCLCRHVKKIKGSKAGLVAISNYKTIFIDPERIESEIFTI